MSNMSNYTKAALFFHDITDPTVSTAKEQSFTLQQFRYECSRNRNSQGTPYGPTLSTSLFLTLKSLPDGYLKELYKRLTENTPSSFSIVFNATFNRNDNQDNALSDYTNALIVTGFMVDIFEGYAPLETLNANQRGRGNSSTADLMMTTVEFLLQTITYIGNNNYQKKLYINY